MSPVLIHIKKKYLYIAGAIVAAVFLYSLFLPLPLMHRFQNRSVVSLRCRYCFALTAKGCDTVYFHALEGDSAFAGVWTQRDEACTTIVGSAFWYSPGWIFPNCFGKLATSSRVAAPDARFLSPGMQWPAIIRRELNRQKSSLRDFKAAERHFKYYMNTHSVADEGYNQVAYHQNDVKERHGEVLRLIARLEAIAASGRPEAVFLPEYTCCSTDREGKLTGKYHPCHHLRRYATGRHGMVVLQSDSHLRPVGTVYLGYPLINLMRFTSVSRPRSCTMYALNYSVMPDSITEATVSRYDGHVWKTPGKAVYDTDIPVVDCAEGAPVVDNRGVLIGVAGKDGIVPIKH